MEEFRLTEARLQTGEQAIAFRRRPAKRLVKTEGVAVESDAGDDYDEAPEAAAPSAPAAPAGTPVTSPMTGIYYISASPGSPPFAKEGETVSAGQIIGLIEAMKVFNEIPAEVRGKIAAVLCEDGEAVEFDKPLFKVDTSG